MLKVCGRHATFTTEVRPLTNEFRFSTDCLGRQRSDIFIMRSALTLLPLTLSPTSSRGKPQRWIKVKLPVNCGPERCERGALQTTLSKLPTEQMKIRQISKLIIQAKQRNHQQLSEILITKNTSTEIWRKSSTISHKTARCLMPPENIVLSKQSSTLTLQPWLNSSKVCMPFRHSIFCWREGGAAGGRLLILERISNTARDRWDLSAVSARAKIQHQ